MPSVARLLSIRKKSVRGILSKILLCLCFVSIAAISVPQVFGDSEVRHFNHDDDYSKDDDNGKGNGQGKGQQNNHCDKHHSDEANDDGHSGSDHGHCDDHGVTLEEKSSLRFPDIVLGVDTGNIIVNPDDSGAAVFDATGTPNQSVRVLVLSAIDMVSGNYSIGVRNFTYGGTLRDDGQGGTGTFNSRGYLYNMRIGGTATVGQHLIPGYYIGQLTLRVVYF